MESVSAENGNLRREQPSIPILFFLSGLFAMDQSEINQIFSLYSYQASIKGLCLLLSLLQFCRLYFVRELAIE